MCPNIYLLALICFQYMLIFMSSLRDAALQVTEKPLTNIQIVIWKSILVEVRLVF